MRARSLRFSLGLPCGGIRSSGSVCATSVDPGRARYDGHGTASLLFLICSVLRLMSAALNDNRRRDMAIECKRCGGPTMPETVIKLRRGLLGFHETRWQGGYCATCRLSALAKLGCLPVSDRPRRPRRVDAVRRDRRVALSNAMDPGNASYQDQHDRPPGAADAAGFGDRWATIWAVARSRRPSPPPRSIRAA
jgi:hypothetical protein